MLKFTYACGQLMAAARSLAVSSGPLPGRLAQAFTDYVAVLEVGDVAPEVAGRFASLYGELQGLAGSAQPGLSDHDAARLIDELFAVYADCARRLVLESAGLGAVGLLKYPE